MKHSLRVFSEHAGGFAGDRGFAEE